MPRTARLSTRLIAAGLGWGLAATAAAEGSPAFGRLFYTPDERQRIDRPAAQPATPPTPEAALPRRLDGVIRRSDGHTTVFIDGRPSAAGVRASGDGSGATLRLPDGEQRRLRVGESLAMPE